VDESAQRGGGHEPHQPEHEQDDGNGLQHGLLFKDLKAGPQMQASSGITCGWRP
jgi:hypothetical protein